MFLLPIYSLISIHSLPHFSLVPFCNNLVHLNYKMLSFICQNKKVFSFFSGCHQVRMRSIFAAPQNFQINLIL